MFWLLEPRWYGVCAVVGLMTGAFGYWKGYEAADKSAEISSLEQTIKVANASLERLRKQAEHDAAAVNAYSQREQLANEALTDLQEQIDQLSAEEDGKPSTDVCRLDEKSAAALRRLAIIASMKERPLQGPALAKPR